MTKGAGKAANDLIEAQAAADVSAINGIVGLANILRIRGILTPADTTALHESMSLPLGLPHYASNAAVQDLQRNLDQLFAIMRALN